MAQDRRFLVVAACVAFAAALVPIPRARAQIADPNFWLTDGNVYATVRSGDTLFVGGNFRNLGPQTGVFSVIGDVSGAPLPGWPRIDGSVNALAPAGTGGW